MMTILLQWIYGCCACLLALYTLAQGVLLWQAWRYRQHVPQAPVMPPDDRLPSVTVQLPVYNEQHVVVRLLDAIALLDYPADKLHIQILDDSTDHTTRLIKQHVQQHPHLSQMSVDHIRRTDRSGYKAGALAHGLAQTASEFVAIFDADFVPPPDFLRRTVPYLLADARLGVVQTRWGHLNAEANWLTRAQMLSVDTHFLVEQRGRHHAKLPLPFNGTGGVWRSACIRDAGGWSHETLTEDLDLSFRAQMRGWRSHLLPDVVVPGELPPQLAAYRQQQARWAKGSAQCLRKLLLPLLRENALSWSQRLMALHHMCQYVPHLLMLILLLLSPPLILLRGLHTLPLAPLGVIGLIPLLMYLVSQLFIQPDFMRVGGRLLAVPVLMLVGTGMIWNNTRALISGFGSPGGEFLRTPKFVQPWQASQYALRGSRTLALSLGGELALMAYGLWGAWLAWQVNVGLLPYLLLYALAFGTVAGWSLRDWWQLAHQAEQSHSSAATSSGD